MDHGGRIQAQGNNVEKSRRWDQATPLLASTGFGHLESLKNEIGQRETKLREKGFAQARQFIERMLANGGTSHAPPVIMKSYPMPPQGPRRIDIEVHRGVAFAPNP